MQKGLNSDIQVRGLKYHIQTEDWGTENPFIVSRVFENGSVCRTIKTSYEKLMKLNSVEMTRMITGAIKKQHEDVIDTLMSKGHI